MKQWELPNGAKVKLLSGAIITFEKMDGMYGHWILNNGELGIGNIDKFIKDGDYYLEAKI
jgi:hypothetical protein